jgi:hypothetical protein
MSTVNGKQKHQITDLVYSNSFGLGYINRIAKLKDVYDGRLYANYDYNDVFYWVKWFNDSDYSQHRFYPAQGIDTLKMFLRAKQRGEDI